MDKKILQKTYPFLQYFLVQVTGEERKTVDNCFSRTKSTKQGEMKKIYDFSAFRLCDLTGEPSNPENSTIVLAAIVLFCSAQDKAKQNKSLNQA